MTRDEEKSSKVCVKCGAPVNEGQKFCPECGQKVEATKEIIANAAIIPKNQTTTGEKPNTESKVNQLQEKKTKAKNKTDEIPVKKAETEIKAEDVKEKKPISIENKKDDQLKTTLNKKQNTKASKKKKIIIAAIIVACISVAVVFQANIIHTKKMEVAKSDYIDNVVLFNGMAIMAAINLEDIGDTCTAYWHDAIWNDQYNSDIDEAIVQSRIDKKDEIANAEERDETLQQKYLDIKNIPDGLEEDKDLIDLQDSAKAVYTSYNDYYYTVINVSGNYTTYSSNKAEKENIFVLNYNALDILLP